MRLAEMMSTSVDTIRLQDSADAAWEKMKMEGIHHLVVMDGKEIVGVISDRDLGGKNGELLRKNRNVSDLVSGSVVTAASDTTFKKAANLMRGNTIGCLPVVDDGKLVGIVTISDLLELIGRGSEKAVAKGTRSTLNHRGSKGRVSRQPTMR